MFVDAKALGRPVLYCILLDHRAMPSDLCRLAGITVPEGFHPCCLGGVLLQDALGTLSVQHGETLQLWLEMDQIPNSPQAPASNPGQVQKRNHNGPEPLDELLELDVPLHVLGNPRTEEQMASELMAAAASPALEHY